MSKQNPERINPLKANVSRQNLRSGPAVASLPGAVKRENAEQYMVLVLVGFAVTVIVTRSFLELTRMV